MEVSVITQRLAWPVNLAPQEDGFILVSFPDIPEALTEGETESEALFEAKDCLIAALGGYIETRRAIPQASASHGRAVIALPALAAAKIALYETMREQGVSNTALASKLGITEGAVRRLIDIDHRSHIGQVEKGLLELGQQITVLTGVA